MILFCEIFCFQYILAMLSQRRELVSHLLVVATAFMR